GPLHAALMVEGFELAFVCGFLLTAMVAFTHGPRAGRAEPALAALGLSAFAVAAFAGRAALAPAAFTLTLLVPVVALARRVRFGAAAPPEEFALVGVGLALGLAGGTLQTLAALGLAAEPAPRFGLRLVSLGMVLCLVLGLGGLLVPTFMRLSEPLAIPGIARAGQRGPRRAFVAAVALLVAGGLACDGAGHPGWGAWLRVAAALASGLLAWKLWRRPGRGDRLSWSLWTAGWCVIAGLVLAALLPARAIAAWHVTFIGGYGLLTLAIATRVVVSHGGHALAEEGLVLGAATVTLAAFALASRLAAEAGALQPWLAIAAGGWMAAWALWLARAAPRLLRVRRPGPALHAPR
ncbi:MAG TPA: NnrS family protein, partial [Candidatus Eisenbacteria bacterium]|nr:NnrS family protein [Candidatus Eisenbacteria bacterium]